jgi:hypothetical protein
MSTIFKQIHTFPKKKITAKEFLSSHGIEMEATQLLSFIEGFMRSPDLLWLMEEYHKAKLKELDLSIEDLSKYNIDKD